MNQTLLTVLSGLIDPETGAPLDLPSRISGAELRNGVATIVLKSSADADQNAVLKADIEDSLSSLDGVERIRVIIEAALGAKTAKKSSASSDITPPAPVMIAVASGKGGVGKSTVSANLAGALARLGYSTGLMDADIYGPSAPRIFGLEHVPGLQKSEAGIEPLEAHGVKLVSMGFLVGERDPVIWRAPMVTGAVRQFLGEVNWGDLDVLVIDLPPGTGDVQLAIAQGVPMTGGVIVSTPQNLALDDAKKAIALMERTAIPVLGLIENMSFFICPNCGEHSEIFGRGGARQEAELTGVPFLGEIPLHPELREASDNGALVALGKGPVADAFLNIASQIMVEAQGANRPAPEIVFEN
jgi:ATP-binding protein involved in chromosome partitioning